MILTPTMAEIKETVTVEHYPHEVFCRSMAIRYIKERDADARRQERKIVAHWCRERWGSPALGEAVNRSDPNFYKTGPYVNAEVARFEFDTEREWSVVNFRYYFKNFHAAMEFKLRWW